MFVAWHSGGLVVGGPTATTGWGCTGVKVLDTRETLSWGNFSLKLERVLAVRKGGNWEGCPGEAILI